jgi:hypothetical protein
MDMHTVGTGVCAGVCASLKNMVTNKAQRTTMDTMYLSVHMRNAKKIATLMRHNTDKTASICQELGVKRLTLTAFIDTQCADLNESVLIAFNCRECYDSDLVVVKIPPLRNELFVAHIQITSRIRVANMTAFNAKMAESMGWTP